MAVIGYARVSTTDQNPQLQLDALHEARATRVFYRPRCQRRYGVPTRA
jgi:DNA invertase Pin-like site-specific DNA recombinase